MAAFFKKKKDDIFLALDIGTESLKALFFSEKNDVLSFSLEYFDRYGSLEGKDYEVSLIKKALSEALKKAREKIPFSKLDRKMKERALKKKDFDCFVTLSPGFLKTRAVSLSFKRKDKRSKISLKEGRAIKERVLVETRKEVSEDFAERGGILPGEIRWLKNEITEIKIDGYRVGSLKGYEGENLEFKVLTVFAPDFYLKKIEKALERFNILGFLPAGEKPAKEGLFLDVGGEVSQFFLKEKGILSKAGEFQAGGRAFSQALTDDLGLEENLARNLKERYGRGELSPGSRKKIKEIFSKERKKWYNAFREEINSLGAFKKIYLFGGSALLPDISEVLKEEGSLEVEIIYPKDLEGIDAGEIKSPQFTPLLLTLYYAKEVLRHYSAK